MRSAHTVEQVRAAEGALLAELPAGTLMDRAAAGLAAAVVDLLGGAYGRRVLLLLGSGDNGGDAAFAGARLARRGCAVEAVLLGSSVHEAGLAALRAAGGRVVPGGSSGESGPRSRPDVVVDGIVGIGGRPGLRPEAVAELERHRGVPVVSVDVPSGVSVDDGRLVGPHVTADLTVTFGTHKVCHLVDPAAAACGAVELVDLGLRLPPVDVVALQAADVSSLLRTPGDTDHKYTRGVVGLRTGTAYSGAGLLSLAGAASGLAGMVRYAGPDEVADLVRAARPDVVVGAGRVQAWVVGSGGGDAAGEDLATALADEVPVVVDADGLRHLPEELPAGTVLTPHAGELARMLGVDRAAVEGAQLEHARRAADRWGAVCLLKGRRSLVVAPDGRAAVTSTGVPWLATAGAGDVLAGLVGALLATGLDAFDAAAVGSWLHGAAATLASAGGPITAPEVASAIPEAVRRLP
ncbi:NAD(P)H-hydrate dehydratase [Nocardioides donggukensis]|uniref:ADP-dependent (S)-NAD(P)H-hydrate dehydratase n=1 Tax=Nocardioides donggukensis TaxID=2774019 RepID=A0A927K6D1_9ACTN|nr:NAD(P)H-hydrate dehydratase [Nocardioides donggukensis]MBD8868540.1 NAD(P)H-hydrate dehydratase [Nocardioides donggukensis]